jgi:hypothetical protein
MSDWRLKFPERAKVTTKAWQTRLKNEVFTHYGRNCACCGESEMVFLAIDHIGGGGREHRRKHEGKNFWRWLKNNGFPKGFRVLCHNCNWAVAFGRVCPHRQNKQEVA